MLSLQRRKNGKKRPKHKKIEHFRQIVLQCKKEEEAGMKVLESIRKRIQEMKFSPKEFEVYQENSLKGTENQHFIKMDNVGENILNVPIQEAIQEDFKENLDHISSQHSQRSPMEVEIHSETKNKRKRPIIEDDEEFGEIFAQNRKAMREKNLPEPESKEAQNNQAPVYFVERSMN